MSDTSDAIPVTYTLDDVSDREMRGLLEGSIRAVAIIEKACGKGERQEGGGGEHESSPPGRIPKEWYTVRAKLREIAAAPDRMADAADGEGRRLRYRPSKCSPAAIRAAIACRRSGTMTVTEAVNFIAAEVAVTPRCVRGWLQRGKEDGAHVMEARFFLALHPAEEA